LNNNNNNKTEEEMQNKIDKKDPKNTIFNINVIFTMFVKSQNTVLKIKLT